MVWPLTPAELAYAAAHVPGPACAGAALRRKSRRCRLRCNRRNSPDAVLPGVAWRGRWQWMTRLDWYELCGEGSAARVQEQMDVLAPSHAGLPGTNRRNLE